MKIEWIRVLRDVLMVVVLATLGTVGFGYLMVGQPVFGHVQGVLDHGARMVVGHLRFGGARVTHQVADDLRDTHRLIDDGV